MRLWLVNYALNDVFMKMDKSIDEKCKKLNYRKLNEIHWKVSDFAYQFKFNLKNEKNYEHRIHRSR